MKKLIYVLIAVFALTSCREDPDLGDLSSDFLVFTNYDGKADFNRFTRYYMPDSVMVIGDTKDPEYWTGSKAADILKAYEDNMQACGYVRTDDKSEADVGLQISYVQSVAYFVDYRNPYWWNEYPGYWLPGYWGDWGYWYYPYPVVYSYSVGSLLTEMAQRRPKTDRRLEQLPERIAERIGRVQHGTDRKGYQSVVRAVPLSGQKRRSRGISSVSTHVEFKNSRIS